LEAINTTARCTDEAFVYEALRSKDKKEINWAASCLQNHLPAFRNYILNRYGSGSSNQHELEKDIQDDFQDAVILVIKHIQSDPPDFEPSKVALRSMKTYLFTSGRYIFMNRQRIKTNRNIIHSKIRQDNVQMASVDGVAEIMKTELQQNMRKAILLLDDNCQRLLSQRFYDELAPREIAAGMNESSNTISQQIIRCREKLKKTLIAQELI